MTISKQQIQELEICYNVVDMGILLVSASLELIFINTWFRKRLPEKFRLLWDTGETFNVKMLYGDSDKSERFERIIDKVLKEKSVMILSEAFHKWLIPLNDKRFLDGKMRQTSIIQPYRECKNMALVQIKDESDTVLKSENLRKSKEQIKEKNVELEKANYQLQLLNEDLVMLNRRIIEREKYITQKSKIEAIGRMAGGIVHDFNNYLAVILGNTELVMYDIAPESPNYECLEDIKQATINARSIIEQIATFRRSETDDKLEERLNIDTVIKAQMPLLKAIVPKYILFDYSYYGCNLSDCFIFANNSQIQRILFNLVINAAHAVCGDNLDNLVKTVEKSDDSRVGGYIHIVVKSAIIEDGNCANAICNAAIDGTDQTLILKGESITNQYDTIIPGKYVAITIQDNGNGISPDNLENIFDPYFTTKPEGKGSGIGLSVVHGIVKHLKGAVYVQSEVNKGTVFTVFLPDVGTFK